MKASQASGAVVMMVMMASLPYNNLLPQVCVCTKRRQTLRIRSRRVECGLLKTAQWDGMDPVPHKLSATSVRLCRPARNVDGLALFELCQTRPDLTELTVSAASFDSPMRGQWNLRKLQKLRIEFEQPSENCILECLQHAEELYLKELTLTYTGAGFANLHASALAKLHVEHLNLEGFSVRQTGALAKKKGRLVDCVLDLPQPDLDFYYNGAPGLELDRCRLSDTPSWRMWGPAVAIASIILAGLILHAARTIVALAVAMFCTWFIGQILELRSIEKSLRR